MEFLYAIPASILLLFALAIAVAVALGGQIFVHRRFRSRDFVAHNEVGGFMIAVAGTLYAVILGFMTVVTWEHFEDARALVVHESDADIDVWHTAVGLPDSVRTRVRADVLAYADIMANREWSFMRRGAADPDAAMVSMDAIDATGSFVPANSGQSNAQAATLQELTIVHDARQERVGANEGGVSWFAWLVLLVGASCIVGFCWLFGLRNAAIHLLMTCTVVIIITSILVLLFELQFPFRSDIGVGPQAWKDAVAHIHQMQAGAMAGMKM